MEPEIVARLSRLEGNGFRLEHGMRNVPPGGIYSFLFLVKRHNNNNNNADDGDGDDGWIENARYKMDSTSTRIVQFDGEPGRSYIFTLQMFSIDDENNCLASWRKCVGFPPMGHEFMSRAKLEKLFERAKEFCKKISENKKPIDYFFRCNSLEGWERVWANRAIASRIRTNGHRSSLLNYSYGGVFFFAREDKPPKSYSGNHIMGFNSVDIFGLPNSMCAFSFFFADAKCYNVKPHPAGRDACHYITIAACRKGSDEENYCLAHLLPINILDNPFLEWRPVVEGEWKFHVPGSGRGGLSYSIAWIELFFMDNLVMHRDPMASIEFIRPERFSEGADFFFNDCDICGINTL